MDMLDGVDYIGCLGSSILLPFAQKMRSLLQRCFRESLPMHRMYEKKKVGTMALSQEVSGNNHSQAPERISRLGDFLYPFIYCLRHSRSGISVRYGSLIYFS